MEEESLFKTAKFWRAFVQGALLLTFLVVFSPEIGVSLTFLWRVLGSIMNRFPWLQDIITEVSNALTEDVVSSLLILLFIAILYLVLFLLSIFFVAQFVLPIQSGQDRWPASIRLFLYGLQRLFFNKIDLHGAALFIREGQRIERPGESESLMWGVVLVDLNSAVVLERRQPYFSGEESDDYAEESEQDDKEPKTKIKIQKKRNPMLGVRAAGPGLVFTGYGERIIGEVDLRKQIRFQPGVQAYTLDGIKVTTTVIAVFALGEKEESVYVTYVGGAKNADNLYFIQIDPDKKVIKGFYEMNPDEREEIDRAYKNHELRAGPQPEETKSSKFSPPYHFDPERVSAAVYARSYNVEGQDIQHWMNLPLKVATEILRNNIARVTYDDLYSPKNQSNAPLKEFKASLARTMRHQGVMSYKFVEHKDGKPLKAGMAWDEKLLDITESARPLPGSRLLRDYGIKIIHAAFGELKPDPGIRKKLMENWMAQWEKEIETIKAENELKTVRIKHNARAQAQMDMASNLSSLFKTAADSPQAMALRVFQALETAATDPSTSQVLPRNVFNMLQSLHSWLLKERKKKDEHDPHPNQSNQKTDEKPDAS